MNEKDMPYNVPTVLSDEPGMRVTATRTGELAVRTVFLYPPSNQVVLDMSVDMTTEHSALNVLDKAFWTITIDGQPATESDLADYSRFNGLSANSKERTLTLKRSS